MTEIVIGGDMEDIPEGTYPAVVKSIETKVSEKFGGEFRAWDFTLASGSVVGGSTSMSTNGKSKGGQWIAALLGRKPEKGETVNVIGKSCLVSVIEKDGWPKVSGVFPPLNMPTPEVVSPVLPTEQEKAGVLPELP